MSDNKSGKSEKNGKGKFAAGGAAGAAILAGILAYFGGIIPGFGRNAGTDTRMPVETTAAVSTVQTETTAATTADTTEMTTSETSAPVSQIAAETTVRTTQKQIPFIDVTVSGNGYTYQNRSYADTELDKLTEALDSAVRAAGTDAVIRITDQEASLNAYKALTDKLTGMSLSFEEVKS